LLRDCFKEQPFDTIARMPRQPRIDILNFPAIFPARTEQFAPESEHLSRPQSSTTTPAGFNPLKLLLG
jgi:hypothetical protein